MMLVGVSALVGGDIIMAMQHRFSLFGCLFDLFLSYVVIRAEPKETKQ
jgi:hypothetical protein